MSRVNQRGLTQEGVAVIILAAGLGTRMKSQKAKVLHEILGRPMVNYVVETARSVTRNNIVLVVGHQAQKVQDVVNREAAVAFVLQEQQLGTGHAVMCGMPQVPEHIREVVIIYGDVPLLSADTLRHLLAEHRRDENELTVLTVMLDNPFGYGRILLDQKKRLCGIMEEADASGEQKKIKMINTGIYCVSRDFLARALSRLQPENEQGEFYLTDIVAIGYAEGVRMGCVLGQNSMETSGINTLDELRRIERYMRDQETSPAVNSA